MYLGRILLVFIFALVTDLVVAAPRYSDPDGCLSCHELVGLSFIDENGVTRSSSIDKSHYYSSLHGSVPCKDCHRKIVDYPHKVENGYVDCTQSCHVEEPSEGVSYTHKPIHEEMENSVHQDGWYKNLAGGNRLEEIETEQDPSCRRCHSNTQYIMPSQLDKFKTAFDHVETECGTCHQGQAWKGQFGGHILRRLIGSRWTGAENNKVCLTCHADVEKMKDVKQKDKETGEEHPPSERFIHAAESYGKTLHGRLLAVGSEYAASCLDCHALSEWKHEIGHYKDPKSVSHVDNLPETCGQSGCHGYAKKPANQGFVNTDMHDLALVNLVALTDWENKETWVPDPVKQSIWFWLWWPLILISIIFILGSLVWWLFFRHDKKVIPILGGSRFERVMIGRKPKKKNVAKKKSVLKKEKNKERE
jgi:sulfite reductase (NADPH) flavoprotein alpha-component